MAETNEYDVIFAALKHPVRRQILLLLEQKGEVSFTDIQSAGGINDTGLLSYHLKELAFLVEQSGRGKYRLSEVGQTSMVLFRKVERERQRSSTAVRRELERWIGKIVFLFFIVGVTLLAPLSVDIYVSVQNLYTPNLSLEQLVGLCLAGLSGMFFGVILFVFYDRHYFSKNMKTNIVHSTFFAVGISLLSISTVYMVHRFEQAAAAGAASPSNVGGTWLLSILRTVSFLASAPLVTYGICKFAKRY
ncbi:MAG: ArsR family transcriptional regulator [Candidatus Bathyarchaeota archaeon]|nr:ArsR family transcriptional regulator [Candidatus Bathyarchaeota archaeon]MDH5745949.1 ArsR family transcriptional regulator [Candidatus Bathyarchaeota archaeon]